MVRYGRYHAICLGAERLKEKFDDEGHGGLFVPQIKLVIAYDEAPIGSRRTTGMQMWADRKLVQRICCD